MVEKAKAEKKTSKKTANKDDEEKKKPATKSRDGSKKPARKPAAKKKKVAAPPESTSPVSPELEDDEKDLSVKVEGEDAKEDDEEWGDIDEDILLKAESAAAAGVTAAGDATTTVKPYFK